MKPSENNATFWQYAHYTDFCSVYHRTGKWMIYVTDENMDETWEIVEKAVMKGIAPCAKVSTALPNPRQESHRSKIICVYVEDYRYEEKTLNVLEALRDIGINSKLKFKRDQETYDGTYGANSFWMYSNQGSREAILYKWTEKCSSL